MAIVSYHHKFIYYPIPKVACSSLKVAISEIMGIELFDDRPHATRFPEIHLNQSNHIDYFKFAFVRNPWDRLVSCYKDKILYCTDHKGIRDAYNGQLPPFMRKYPFEKGMSFSSFVEAVSLIPDKDAEDHFVSQITFLSHNGKLVTDFLGRFENIENDWGDICKRLAIPATPLGHRKQIIDKPYQDFYTDRLVALVGERYKKDIATFGYTF